MRQKESTLKLTKRIGSPFYYVAGMHNGVRIRMSTFQTTMGMANVEMGKLIAGLNDSEGFSSTFEDVADVHLELITKKTAYKDMEYYKKLKKFLERIPMSEIGFRPKQVAKVRKLHVLNEYIMDRACDHVSVTTVNKELSFLNLLGNKAVKEYGLLKYWVPIRLIDRDEAMFYGLKMPVEKQALTGDMQVVLFNLLFTYSEKLRDMAIFSINTGQRDSVVCNLRWDWFHDCNPYYFTIPSQYMKNGKQATVVLNFTAEDIVLKRKGNSSEYVFPNMKTQNCWGYIEARRLAAKSIPEIANTDVHSYKRTFITRLYDCGVPHDWVQRLANHTVPGVTERYNQETAETRKVMFDYLQLLVTGVSYKPSLKLHKGVANGN